MSKGKLAAIIIACTIVIIVVIVINTRPPTATTPAQNYTLTTHISPSGAGSVSPSGGEYESGLQITLTATPASDYTFDYWALAASGSSNTVTITMNSDKTIGAYFKVVEPEPTPEEPDEPAIPTQFTTYTDEVGLFSISYPPEWEPALEYMEEIEQASKDIIDSITSDIPLEEYILLFIAGLSTDFDPRVVIGVAPIPVDTWTLDEFVTSSIEGIKSIMSDYHEFSRVKTTIDNRTAVIIELQANVAQLGMYRQMQMYLLVGKTVWIVGCGTSPDKYSEWEDDFDAIVRSLRILK